MTYTNEMPNRCFHLIFQCNSIHDPVIRTSRKPATGHQKMKQHHAAVLVEVERDTSR